MQDAGGIVHRAVWIDGDWEALFTEPLSNTVGKTRAYEKYLLARSDPKPRLRNIHYRPKFHPLSFIINSKFS
jgi:hypothetical protein